MKRLMSVFAHRKKQPVLFSLLCAFLAVLFFTPSANAQPLYPDTVILIKNVSVWDGTSENAKENQQVLVVKNLIRQIGANLTPLAGARVIDGKGGTLIPGLSDAHLHLMMTDENTSAIFNNYEWSYMGARATVSALHFLMQGITTARDMAGPSTGLKKAIDEGSVPGPRIYPSGAGISQTSGHGDMRNLNSLNPHLTEGIADKFSLEDWMYVVDGAANVLNAVRENLRHGATQIKMMAGGGVISHFDPIHTVQFTEEELKAGVQAAADWGTYVAVHAYNSTSIQRALNAGVISIEHGQLIDEPTMRLLKEKGAWLDPQANWILLDPKLSPSPEKFKEVQSGVYNEMDLAKKYGVKLAFGTDVFGHLGIETDELKEFTARAKWFTPVEILRQATSANARLFALCGKLNPYTEGPLGVIKEGAYADLLIYNSNPLKDISVVVDFKQHLKLIMKDGKIYKNEL